MALLLPNNVELQEVTRTGNAWVVIAHDLLAFPGKFILWQIDVLLDEPTKVVLNRPLVL
jgi:hypothetical protein